MTALSKGARCDASFRDPDGFVFEKEGTIFRQINRSYSDDFNHLLASGLYEKLAASRLLLAHEEAALDIALTSEAYKIIRPQPVPFISYPYEWCFEQLRQAALLTLAVQKISLAHGMSLKDSSAFNVQFIGCRPVFIDTLSFARFDGATPWYGYQQFCQHFLAPLLLGQHCGGRLNRLLLPFLDGIPLDLASSLLPWQSWLHWPSLLNIHMQAKLQQAVGQASASRQTRQKVDLKSQLAILDALEGSIEKLRLPARKAYWVSYYEDNSYTQEAAAEKLRIIDSILSQIGHGLLWDLGANIGRFSRLAAWQGFTTIAFDQDEACIQALFSEGLKMGDENCLPLLLDLTNPTPAAGWQHAERLSLEQRGPADCVLALALIHHLIVTYEIPLDKLADFFSKIARRLVVEFVPMDDPQVKRLLSGMKHSFHHFDRALFEREFTRFFDIRSQHELSGQNRWIYDCVRKA